MILCCGEMLIDMIPEATVSGGQGFVPHSGGAVFNTAIALGRLGAPVGMLSGQSSDMFGQQLLAGLHAASVDTSNIILSDRPTTLAFVQITDGHASYSFVDENSAGRMLTPDDMPALGGDISALYFGGISLACEPSADAYAALLAAQGASRPVMLDPNIRPTFIADAQRFRTRMMGMIGSADIVKVSDEDLNWLSPEDSSLEDKANKMLAMGPQMVILTKGSAGATAFLHGGQSVFVPSNKVEVADTVGAGDTFNAGVLAKLAARGVLTKGALKSLSVDDVEAALQHGNKVAAVTVSRAGANPPWAHEI